MPWSADIAIMQISQSLRAIFTATSGVRVAPASVAEDLISIFPDTELVYGMLQADLKPWAAHARGKRRY
jgi:hypothetical protein